MPTTMQLHDDDLAHHANVAIVPPTVDSLLQK